MNSTAKIDRKLFWTLFQILERVKTKKIKQRIPTPQNYVPRASWERPQKTPYERPHMVLYVMPRGVPCQRPFNAEIWRPGDVPIMSYMKRQGCPLPMSWRRPLPTSFGRHDNVLYVTSRDVPCQRPKGVLYRRPLEVEMWRPEDVPM